MTIEQIAAAAGISPRGLQMAFRRHRGTTPMDFWRQLRLARAHADLMFAVPGTTVTAIALRWGFTHFSRFSESYRARFGLSPSATLRAGRDAGFQD
jgi:transcriptional regulator GlxA family with amidase domain